MSENTIIVYRNLHSSEPATIAPYNLPEATLKSFYDTHGHQSWWNDYFYQMAVPMEEAVRLGYRRGMSESERIALAATLLEGLNDKLTRTALAASGKKVRKEYVPDLPVDPSDAMAVVREFCK